MFAVWRIEPCDVSFSFVFLFVVLVVIVCGCWFDKDNKDNNTESKTKNCNCRIKEACLVNQKCQTSSLIYQATVTRHDNNKEESYIGLTDNTFKTRYNGHTSSFRNEQYRNATTLSNYIWTLKDKNINYSLK